MPPRAADDESGASSERKAGQNSTGGAGKLKIWVLEGRNLSLPEGVSASPAVEEAEKKAHARNASINPRESIQRKKSWWLPYVVLEFDKNEVMIDALLGSYTSATVPSIHGGLVHSLIYTLLLLGSRDAPKWQSHAELSAASRFLNICLNL